MQSVLRGLAKKCSKQTPGPIPKGIIAELPEKNGVFPPLFPLLFPAVHCAGTAGVAESPRSRALLSLLPASMGGSEMSR